MGILSDIFQFHDAGEGPSEETVEQYGIPACSLFTVLDPGDLHQRVDIINEQDDVLYQTKSSVFTLFSATDITDSKGGQVAHIERRPISLHEKHFITMADGRQFTLSNQLLRVIKDVTDIEGLGWKIQGNVLGLKFKLLDENDELVAVIGQKLVSIHNRFSIDIYQPRYEPVIVSIVIALQKMLQARQESDN